MKGISSTLLLAIAIVGIDGYLVYQRSTSAPAAQIETSQPEVVNQAPRNGALRTRTYAGQTFEAADPGSTVTEFPPVGDVTAGDAAPVDTSPSDSSKAPISTAQPNTTQSDALQANGGAPNWGDDQPTLNFVVPDDTPDWRSQEERTAEESFMNSPIMAPVWYAAAQNGYFDDPNSIGLDGSNGQPPNANPLVPGAYGGY